MCKKGRRGNDDEKYTVFLLVGLTLAFGIVSCHAETLQQPTDVFEVSDDGRKMQIVTVLDEGTEYELIEPGCNAGGFYL